MIYVCDEISNFWVGDDGGNLKNQDFPFIYTFEIMFWKKKSIPLKLVKNKITQHIFEFSKVVCQNIKLEILSIASLWG